MFLSCGGTPQEDQQTQLPWTIESCQEVNTNQKAYRSCAVTYGIYVANVQLGHHVGPPTFGTGSIPKAVDCVWKPLTQLASVGEVVLTLKRIDLSGCKDNTWGP